MIVMRILIECFTGKFWLHSSLCDPKPLEYPDTNVTVYVCHMLQRNIEQCSRVYDCVPNYIIPVLPTERQIETIEKAVIGKFFATAGKREHNEKV